MAKGIYVGVGGQIVKGNIIPKTWSGSNSPYSASGAVLYASGEYSGYPAKYACDGDTKTNYQSNNVTDCWLKLAFLQPQKITKMKTWITALSDSYFSSAVIQGSNNDSTWTELYKITSPQTALTEITLNNTNNYYYYRICVTSTYASRPPIIYEWQASEYVQNPVARKVKKAYIGVGGKARKVKKAYIGVGGKARLFYSAEQALTYYGKITDLSAARYGLAATSIGSYALFAGGYSSSADTEYATVDTYNTSLVKGTATNLSVARHQMPAITIGNYALFAGGYAYGTGRLATVDTYNTSLTKGTATNLSVARNDLATTKIGNYALFAGGTQNSGASATVDTYNTSLTKGTATSLSVATTELAGTTIGNYALFGGGGYSTPSDSVVNTYTSSLVKGTTTDLSVARRRLAATTVGDYALFAGGSYYESDGSTTYSAVVDTYNKSLAKGTATSLASSRAYLKGASLGSYAIFAGGNSTYVDTYNETLTKGRLTVSTHNLAQHLAATVIGSYAIFAGGSSSKPTADAFQVL